MKLLRIIILFAAITGINASCKKEDGTAKISVLLHDNPSLYDSVKIDVREVQVHTDGSGWMKLTTNAGVYDLLLLQNGIDTLLASSQDIPAGNLSQVRLILGVNNSVVDSGVTHPLELSSEDESGLKLNVHQELHDNTNYLIVFDFDASKSILENNNGSYRLKPVLSASIQ
jgi:hypothetical protein